jgi:hypothetical protein
VFGEVLCSFVVVVLVLLVASSAGQTVTCLVNGYESKVTVPIDSGYALLSLKLSASGNDDEIFVRAAALTSVVLDVQAVVFNVPLAQVPRLADGSTVDLTSSKGQLINAEGGHVDVKNATEVTIAVMAKCPTSGFESLACKILGSSLSVDVSASVKRDGQFHIPVILNRETTQFAVKEGQFVFFFARGDMAAAKKLYYAVNKVLYQQVGFMGVFESVVVPHFSINSDDLPTTDSGILGTSLELRPDTPIIVGMLVKKANTLSSSVDMFTRLRFNFALGSEPQNTVQPFAQGSCPEVSRYGIVVSGADAGSSSPTVPPGPKTPLPPAPADTCAAAEKLQPQCVRMCASMGKPFVKKCSCAVGSTLPAVECTADQSCQAILAQCSKLCAPSAFVKCDCSTEPSAASPFTIECASASADMTATSAAERLAATSLVPLLLARVAASVQ